MDNERKLSVIHYPLSTLKKTLLASLGLMRLESQKEDTKLANNRVYEVMYIAESETTDDVIADMNKVVEKIVTDEGGEIVNTEDMGIRNLAYPIRKKDNGHYILFEINGSGKEIAEIERRFRVNDFVMRYLTVRVDEERKTAQKLTDKREAKRKRVTDLMSRKGTEDTQAQENQQGGDE